MTAELNPTWQIDLDFPAFIAKRQESYRQHVSGNITDYCFSLDLQMRRRLAAIKPLQIASKAYVAFKMQLQRQIMTMRGVTVGPKQFPHIHAIAQDCAGRLGIGIPQVFILYNTTMDAYTLAAEESGDMIVLHSSLVEVMSEAELRFIIGHESGHIHNLHSVYNNLGQVLSNEALKRAARFIPGASAVIALLSQGAGLFLKSWVRACEATADRAGLICCGNFDTARYALAKLATGGGQALKDINLDQFVKQLETSQATPVRLWESLTDHPIIGKRIRMLQIFSQCEVLFSWRPEMRNDKPVLSKAQTDAQCEQILSVFLRN